MRLNDLLHETEELADKVIKELESAEFLSEETVEDAINSLETLKTRQAVLNWAIDRHEKKSRT